MTELDRINGELASIIEQLNALPRDEIAQRWALRTRQDELRAEAEQFREDIDESRSTEELRRELAARRSQLDAIYDQGVDMVSQNGGGDKGSGTTSGTEAALNEQIREAQGAGTLSARIAKIEATLAARESA